MVRFLTAGESHGRALVVILEGIPAGLTIDPGDIARHLRRRQAGYGRGRRMAIESDRAEILSGVRAGETIGGPIAISIDNRDWANWQSTMRVFEEPPEGAGGTRRPPVTRPRPGHADFAGLVKYGRDDIRDARTECHVQSHPLGPGAGRPQPKHRGSGRTDPEERRLTCGRDVGQLKAHDVSVEPDGLFQVGDGEVRFEEPLSGNHRACLLRQYPMRLSADTPRGLTCNVA
jgi:hypothetical protein